MFMFYIKIPVAVTKKKNGIIKNIYTINDYMITFEIKFFLLYHFLKAFSWSEIWICRWKLCS